MRNPAIGLHGTGGRSEPPMHPGRFKLSLKSLCALIPRIGRFRMMRFLITTLSIFWFEHRKAACVSSVVLHPPCRFRPGLSLTASAGHRMRRLGPTFGPHWPSRHPHEGASCNEPCSRRPTRPALRVYTRPSLSARARSGRERTAGRGGEYVPSTHTSASKGEASRQPSGCT
jgi:hypothetical protein